MREDNSREFKGYSREFKVGDKVFAEAYGVGEVTKIVDQHICYPVRVRFKSALKWSDSDVGYTLDGRFYTSTPDEGRDITHYEEPEQDKQTIADRMTIAGSWKTEIPANVRRNLLGDMRCSISYAGEQVSIGEADYASLQEIREAIEWIVEQFNGDVTWK